MDGNDPLKMTKSDVREYCFKVWRAESRDFSKAERRIKKEDIYVANRSTISRWAKAYGWEERADNLDLRQEKALSIEDEVLKDLTAQHKKITDYLNAQPIDRVDTAVLNTLVSVDRQIVDIVAKIRKNKLDALSGEPAELVQFNVKLLGDGARE